MTQDSSKTSSAAEKYNIKSGTMADEEEYPALAKFKVPIYNAQATNMLLNDLLRLKSTNNNKSSRSGEKIVVQNPLNPTQHNLYFMVPSGKSESSHYMFGNTLK